MNEIKEFKDSIWAVIETQIPEKYKIIFNKYVEKALDKLDSFAKNNLAENKVIIEKIAKYLAGIAILCFYLKWINLAMGLFAVVICLFLLGDSIKFYSNINKSLKKLLSSVFPWTIGLTILTYLAIASNLDDTLTNGAQFKFQIDLFKLILSFVVASFITLFYHTLNIVILSLIFLILIIIKKAVHYIIHNRIFMALIGTYIANLRNALVAAIISGIITAITSLFT